MKRFLMLLFAIIVFQNGFAQFSKKKEIIVEIVMHRVELGETVKMISRKYFVDPSEIYKYNKFAIEGVTQGMVLQIPVPVKDQNSETIIEEVAKNDSPKKVSGPKIEKKVEGSSSNDEQLISDSVSISIHKVEPKETLFSLSKKYGVTVDDIKNLNPSVAESGLQVGQVINIGKSTGSYKLNPVSNTSKEVAVSDDKKEVDEAPKKPAVVELKARQTVTHSVEAHETLFGISKVYGITVEDIKALNPQVESGLQIGMKLKIKKPDASEVLASTSTTSTDIVKGSMVEHTVEPKETLYSLSKKYNITVEQVYELNPNVKELGLQVGQVVKLKKAE